MTYRPTVLLALIFISGCAVAPSPDVASLTGCPHAALPCAQDKPISILGTEGDQSDLLERTVKAASQAFEDEFAVVTPPSVIVPGGNISKIVSERLSDNGYEVLMPWIREQDRDALIETQVRRQVEDQMAGEPKPVIEATIKAALAQVQTDPSAQTDRTDLYALAHEMGHKWFIAQFSKPGEKQTGHAYGGWAPDWLDEAAAIVLETQESHQRRRVVFAEMNLDRRIPLATFLTMEHPLADAARKLADAQAAMDTDDTGPTSRTIILTGEEGKAFLANSGADFAADFYAQALVFTDYLKIKTGNKSVLADLATALADNVSIEHWLQRYNALPNDLSTLQQDWDRYANSVIA